MKKQLNLIKQSQRIDPSYTNPVSSDEEEDSIPDAVAFNHAAQSLAKAGGMQIQPNVSTTHTPIIDSGVPTAGDPSAANSTRAAPNNLFGMKNVNIPNIIAAPNWTAILSAVQGSGSTLDLPALQTACKIHNSIAVYAAMVSLLYSL